LLATVALCQTTEAKPELKWRSSSSSSTSLTAITGPQSLVLSVGKGRIVINLQTGQVDLPKDMTLPNAAVAFWLQVARSFPECRNAILLGDSTPLTTTWGEDYMKEHPMFGGEVAAKKFHFIMLTGPRGGPSYELGLRSDGVVVWREVK
jgi:hypothetical protein